MKRIFLPLALILLTACTNQPASEIPQSTVPPESRISPTTDETGTPVPTPDLSQRPMVWFAPLPPLPMDAGRPFTGAEDYMALFAADAPWTETAERLSVFKVYAEWVGSTTDSNLRQVIEFAHQHGLGLAMEDGPLALPTDCGSGFESAGGPQNVKKLAQRIKDLGGTLSFIAMDEPYYQFSLDQSAGACRYPAEQLAQKVMAYINAAREVFPEVIVGDIEVLHKDMDPVVYEEWLTVFQQATGSSLPFLHMDLDYSGENWAERLKVLDDFTEQQGIEFGIIYFGNWDDLSDETWLANTGERVMEYERIAGHQPDHVIFQSWQDHPDLSLPESEPYTFTGFIKRYFDDRSSLGLRREGAGANLAYGKTVRVSKISPDSKAEYAVDGNPGRCWVAGDFAPQWVTIDLGAPYKISEIRVRIGQSPAGRSVHNIYSKGSGNGENYVLLTSFDGETDNMSLLTYKLPAPLEGVQFIKVEAASSPSWISYCELEVIAAE